MRCFTMLLRVAFAALVAVAAIATPSQAATSWADPPLLVASFVKAAPADGYAAHPRGPCPSQICVGEPTAIVTVAACSVREAGTRIVFRPCAKSLLQGLSPAAEPHPPRIA